MVCRPFEAKPSNHIAEFDVFAVDDALALDHSHDESRQVVFAVGIETRHLGGFAADQGAAVVLAGFGQAFNDLLGDIRVELAGGKIVHKEKRGGALNGDVVDAMVHQIGADGVMHIHLEGNFQFGADAVDARNQHRIGIFLFVDGEKRRQNRRFHSARCA